MKRHIIFGLILCLLIIMMQPAVAYNRKEHDEHIELVLFGESQYKDGLAVAGKIKAIEVAAYLAIDQYNGNGAEELEYLKKENIPNLPATIDEIDFTSNYSHRKYTHRGWNIQYSKESHWDLRKTIFFNTVKTEIFNEKTSIIDTILNSNKYDELCESFCALIYYTHIIGDYLEAENYKGLGYVAPLVRPHDKDNPGIIKEVKNHLEVLFSSQKGNFTYSAMMGELDNLYYKAEKLVSPNGGVREEGFEEYKKCAEYLLEEILEAFVPSLFKNEEYFSRAFYSK